MKPKEYLVKHGHIKEAGRGRLSKEHIAIIEEAVKGGAFIEGYSISTPANDAEPVEVKRAPAVDVYDVPDEVRPERDWEAYSESGAAVGMRTICNLCGNSLNYCHHQTPVVWVDHKTMTGVVFSPRKTPVKRFY